MSAEEDDLIRVAALEVERLAKLPAPITYFALRLAKRVFEREADPELYLIELLEGIERRAQERARNKFG